MTLATLRALLTLARGPAVERLDDPTPAGAARAYLPRWLEWTWAPGVGIDVKDTGPYSTWAMARTLAQDGVQQADLTDPGTIAALKVALALALGFDPGPLGVSCSFGPLRNGMPPRERVGWYISTPDAEMYFVRTGHATGDTDEIVSDETAGEDDTIKALVLACRCVVERSKASEGASCPAA